MKPISFICMLAALTLPSAFAAPEWKSYDDFIIEREFDKHTYTLKSNLR